MTDYLDDDTLATALRSEVPERPEGYWASIDATLAAAAAPTATVATAPAAATSMSRATSVNSVSNSALVDAVTDISTGSTSLRHASRGSGDDSSTRARMIDRLRSWPVLAAAAALIIVAVLLSVRSLPSNDETVDAEFTTVGGSAISSAQLDELPGPVQNLDHWNGVYSVWDCTADNGAGGWLPAFQSMEDDVGIHSHGDGLISIHPFFETSAGANATFSHFESSMNIDVTTEAILLDDGRSLAAGTMCGGEPAVVQIRRWQSDFDLRTNPGLEPRVVLDDFGSERFYNDREVWIIALAPAGAELPLPPSERFDKLDGWWTPLPEHLPAGVAFEGARPETVPPEDGYTALRSVSSGDAADLAIGRLLALQNNATPGMVPPLADAYSVPGSGHHWVAASWPAQIVAELFMYELLDEQPDITTSLVCWAVSLPQIDGRGAGGCSGADEPFRLGTRTNTDTFTLDLPNRSNTFESVVLWDAPADAAWMILHTTTGERFVSEVVDGTSYAAWPSAAGRKDTISVLTINGDLVWGDDL